MHYCVVTYGIYTLAILDKLDKLYSINFSFNSLKRYQFVNTFIYT